MRSLLRLTARMLMGSTFVLLGADALREPGGRVGMATGTLTTLRKVLPLPDDDELVVRGNAAAQVVGGALLSVGRWPRLSALMLVGSLVPTTMAGHAFWAVEEPANRKAQRVQFCKNMALVGGLLFAVLDEPTVN